MNCLKFPHHHRCCSLDGVLGCVSCLSLFVIFAGASLAPGGHAIDLVLRTNSAVGVHLTDGAVHGLLGLLEREAEETISADHLSITLDLSFQVSWNIRLEFTNANYHVLLGLILRVKCSSFLTSDALDYRVGSANIQAEASAKYVLRVES